MSLRSRIYAAIGSVLHADVGRRCALAAAISLPFTCWYLAASWYIATHPDRAPYVDGQVLRRFFIPMLAVTSAGWVAVMVASRFVIGRERAGLWLQHATAQLFALSYGLSAYLFGTSTNGFTAAVLLAGGAFGFILLDKKATIPGVLALLAVLITAAVAEQLGSLPYAPLLRASPFGQGRLATSWITVFGGVTFLLATFCFVLIDSLIEGWDARQESLASTRRELVRAGAMLESSHRERSKAFDDLKRAQAKALQAEKMASLGELVAGAAHELNNPASFVQGSLANLSEYASTFAHVLSVYEQSPEASPETRTVIAAESTRLRVADHLHDVPELLRICTEGSERVARIVADLRTYAREDGARTPVEIAAGIESTLRLLRARLIGASIAVRSDIDERALVHADAAQLNQVWMNLLGNAADAAEGTPAAEIAISVRRRDDWIEVEILDNGPGIPADVAARIFDPFFTTKAVGRGTGLGLGIARGIVESHGGELTIESEPGRTRALVRLPALSAAPTVGAEPA